jgi:hypothetical protein
VGEVLLEVEAWREEAPEEEEELEVEESAAAAR